MMPTTITRNLKVAAVVATTFLRSSFASADISKRHVQLVTPAPFVWAEYGPANPLAADGSDYPCKVPYGGEFNIQTAATKIRIGEEYTVSFAGTAVHGGGSCQLALTEGHAPTPESVWKVIQSIEGGCPKANVTGNIEEGQSPDTYIFTIPDDFATGNYTWAWTWVNKISRSPEFYMNCAPIAVVGASEGSPKRVKAQRHHLQRSRATRTYPDLFLANIGAASSGCDTSEATYSQIAIAYPYPGDSVWYPNGQKDLFPQPCDGNPRNNPAAASGSRGSGGDASKSTVIPSSGPTNPLVAATALELPMSVESVPKDTLTSSAAAASSAATTTLDGSCTDGHLLCVGGTQFSICTGGVWVAPQSLAENVTCVEQGESEGLKTALN